MIRWRTTVIILFGLYLILAIGQQNFASRLTVPLVIAGMLVNWLLPAWHIVVVGAHQLQRRFTIPELITLTLATSFTVVPLLLLVENVVLRTLSPLLPFINSAILTLLVFITRADNHLPTLSIDRNTIKSLFVSPLIWVLTLQIVITSLLTHAFLALPDIDPYKWANWYAQWLAGGSTTLPTRPLFYFFVYLFTPASHLELYPFFKYIFPYLPSSLIFLSYLTLPQPRTPLTQTPWLLLPLFIPSLILYSALPIPQSLLIFIVFFFFHFILHAHATQNLLFYWLAGALISIAFFYHQGAALILIVWIGATILWQLTPLIRLIRRYRTSSLLIGLGLTYFFFQSGLYAFIMHWITRITVMLKINPNWYFPAYYRSIDGQLVGWPGATGVLKYYAFYVGPPLLALLFIVIVLVAIQPPLRRYFRPLYTPTSPLFVIGLCTLLFFIIAEILPRLANIALLPERAWLFGGVFASVMLWQLLQRPRPKPRLEYLLIILTLISVSGALYANHLKAHTIPDYQVQAAEWIKNNLPPDRIMVSADQPYVLTTNAESRIMPLDVTSLCNLDLTNDEFVRDLWYRATAEPEHERNHITEVYLGRLRTLIATDRTITLADLETTSEHFINLLNKNAHAHDDITDFKKRAYIYFTRPDPQNILLTRPYVQANTEATCENPVFDQRPDVFQKVYDDAGRVMIWRFAS